MSKWIVKGEGGTQGQPVRPWPPLLMGRQVPAAHAQGAARLPTSRGAQDLPGRPLSTGGCRPCTRGGQVALGKGGPATLSMGDRTAVALAAHTQRGRPCLIIFLKKVVFTKHKFNSFYRKNIYNNFFVVKIS